MAMLSHSNENCVSAKSRWELRQHPLKQPAENSDTVIASVGDKPSVEAGELLISRDFGESWDLCEMSHPANSMIWTIGSNAADDCLLFAATIFGQIFKSIDGGEKRSPPCEIHARFK